MLSYFVSIRLTTSSLTPLPQKLDFFLNAKLLVFTPILISGIELSGSTSANCLGALELASSWIIGKVITHIFSRQSNALVVWKSSFRFRLPKYFLRSERPQFFSSKQRIQVILIFKNSYYSCHAPRIYLVRTINIIKVNNFIFEFPIMKSNILAIELQTKLQEYWLNKFNDIEYTSNIKDTF